MSRSPRLRAIVAVAAAWLALGPPADGAERRTTPVTRIDDVALVDRASVAAAFEAHLPIAIEGFPIGDGTVVDLDLQPFRITRGDTKFVVVGEDLLEREIAFDHESIVLLRGDVRGHAGSHVFLALGDDLSIGRIELGPGRRTVHVEQAAPATDAFALRVSAGDSAGFGGGGGPSCLCEAAPSPLPAPRVQPAAGSGGGVPTTGRVRSIELAIETDFDYYVLFNHVDRATAYIISLYAAVSDIYARDADSTFVVTYVRLWQTPDDLFNDGNPLPDFRTYWSENMGEIRRDVAQFLTGRRDLPAGGTATLGTICSFAQGYSWAGYVLGSFDASRSSAFNRDLNTTAHELGHNVGSLHTQSYGLDTCHNPSTTPQRGTIMSYCAQTFTGGHANADARFHTFVQDVLRTSVAADQCLDDDCNLNGIVDELDISSGTSADVNADSVPDECQDCNDNGVLDDADIAGGSSLDVDGNGVPDDCQPDCNGNAIPDWLDVLPVYVASFSDDFETDRGWTAENLGAVTGDLERGVPVNDPDWNFDPPSDGDGSGQCWLTWNEAGPTPLEGGAVRLTSPPIDFEVESVALRYDYYLFLGGGEAVGSIAVEVSAQPGGVSWIEVARHDTTNGSIWRTAQMDEDELLSAGVVPAADLRVRFTITADEGFLEGAIDGVFVGSLYSPVAEDRYGNGVLDECEADCNGNGTSDYTEIQFDMSLDLDRNGVLDACQDCDGNGVPDLDQRGLAWDAWIADLEAPALKRFIWNAGTEAQDSDDGSLAMPNDVIATADGRVLVSLGSTNRVVEFTRDGGFVGDFIADGVGGLSDPGTMLVHEPTGDVFVASTGSSNVLRYASDGTFIGEVMASGAAGLTEPFGIAFDADGMLYVTDGDRVLRFLDDGTFIDEYVVSADNGGMNRPRGIAFLPSGDLLVVSYGTDSVLRFDGETGAFVEKFNKNGTDTVLTLDQPWGIRIGPDGGVYVSRTHDHEKESGGDGDGDGDGDGEGNLHLTNARIMHFDPVLGYFLRAYIQGANSNLVHPTGFAFLPDADGADCNFNLTPDACDIASGDSDDVNSNGIPDECEGLCPADLDGDGIIGFRDLLRLLDRWGICFSCGPADLDASGHVDMSDLAILIANWGDC